jgi:serine/threonine protein phosphatase 1
MTTPVYAVGDIHGRKDELLRVLDVIVRDSASLRVLRPKVVFLGDYVNRGPDSRGVVHVLTSRKVFDAFDPVFLLGNHDLCVLSVLEGKPPVDWMEVGGGATLASYGIDSKSAPVKVLADRLRQEMPEVHQAFFRDLQIFHSIPGYFFCHAGIDPSVPPGEQGVEALIYGVEPFLSWKGSFGQRVVHGHWARRKVEILPNRIGLDTGCGVRADGFLSAIAIDGAEVRVLPSR